MTPSLIKHEQFCNQPAMNDDEDAITTRKSSSLITMTVRVSLGWHWHVIPPVPNTTIK